MNDAVVIDLRQFKPAVFAGYFHTKTAELSQSFNHSGRNLARPVDFIRIQIFLEKPGHLITNFIPGPAVLNALFRIGKNKIPANASQEKIPDETGVFPFLLARFLGNFKCGLLLCYGHGLTWLDVYYFGKNRKKPVVSCFSPFTPNKNGGKSQNAYQHNHSTCWKIEPIG